MLTSYAARRMPSRFSRNKIANVASGRSAPATPGRESLTPREKPGIKIIGAEAETAAPAALSFEKNSPQVFKNWKASFVDGAGGQSVFPRMWERMKPLVDGYIVVTLEETKNAMRLMAEKARIIS